MPATILIIEDNPANHELAKYLLQAHGYATLSATDGEEGVSAARSHRPDLILCDLEMPVMNGYEVVRLLRSDPQFSRTAIIAVTAFSMPGDRGAALDAGFDGYISKPIDPERFVRQIEESLPPESHAARPRPER
jgi:CheY-like chemotaxis protein